MKKILCFFIVMAVLLSTVTINVFAAETITINPILAKYPGDSVTISGNTTLSTVNIKILYPNGDAYNVESVQSSGGTYSYTFRLVSSGLQYGTYTVVAGSGTIVAVTEFEVKPLEPPEEPEEPDEPEGPEEPGEPEEPEEPGETAGPGKDGTSTTGTENINEIIDRIKQLEGSRDKKGKELKDEQDKLFKELENAVYEDLAQEIGADVKDSKATIKIDKKSADSIIKSMDDIVNTIDEINKKLEEGGSSRKVRKKLTIITDVDTDTGISSIEAEIPSSIFDAAEEKGIESIEIISEVASLEIPVGFIEQGKRGTNVSISASKIELDEQQKSMLSEEQRKILEQQGTVYDFNVMVDGQQVSGFNGKITIRIKYELKEGEDKDNITVLYLADDGTVKNMVGKYDEATGEVIFTTDHFSKFVVKSLKITFSDVNEGYWGKTYVESMAAKGIINGRPNGSYDPNGLVTRAEFAKMITIAMGIVDDDAKCTFSDVTEDKWYYTYVASAVNAGIIKGRPNNVFAPDDKITRQEMAVMIHRALGETAAKDSRILFNFVDRKKIAEWAVNALAAIIEAEIMNGKPGGIIDPEGYSTRAEAAAVIYRYFNY